MFVHRCLAAFSSTLNKFKSYCSVISLKETAHVLWWPGSLCLSARSLVCFVVGGKM